MISVKNFKSGSNYFSSHFLYLSESMVEGYDYSKPVDIFAVGFEEIVDLNASNIMKAR